MGNELSDIHDINTTLKEKSNHQDEKDNSIEYKYLDDDYDLMQECVIDPDNDRRQPIHSFRNKVDNPIIQCIGSLRITYSSSENPPVKTLGTGTVFHVDDKKKLCYVVTAAHNYMATLRECVLCKKKTQRPRCLSNGCNKKKTTKITPIQLIEADSIYFQRRCTKRNAKLNEENFKFGNIIQSYPIVECKLRKELFNNYPQPHSGYDLCIMVFKCKDKDELASYRSNCSKIHLVCDPFLGKKISSNIGKNQLNIFGYPAEKFTKESQEKQFYMWGQSTSAMKGHNMKIITNIETGKAYVLNDDIDTTGGQSGACIWDAYEKQQDDEHFRIYAVHSGGFTGSKRKKTIRANVATFLDDNNLKWIEEQVPGFKGQIIESVKIDAPKIENLLEDNLYVQYLVSIYVHSNGCTMAYCSFGAPDDVHLVAYSNYVRNACPASLLMDKKTNTCSIGFDADSMFTEKKEKDDCAYFQHIEHYLYSNVHFEANSCISAADGDTIMSIGDLTIHFLDEMIKRVLSDINNKNKLYGISHIIDRNDIFLIMSVPSTWNEYDKKLMTNCMNKLKLLSFDFIPDMVATSFFAAQSIDKTITTSKSPFMILDCRANNTILAIIENSNAQCQFKIIHKEKISKGSVNVADSFVNLLEQLLPKEIIDLVTKSQWKKQKEIFLQSMNSCPWDLQGWMYWNVSFCKIIQQYLKEKKRKQKKDPTYNNMKSQIDEYKIPNTDITGAFMLTQHCLKINKAGWLYLCEETIMDITKFLKNTLTSSKSKKCKTIVLLADFGKSQVFGSELLKEKLLASRLMNEFRNKNFVQLSSQPEIAVVKGGLHWKC